MEGIGVKHRSVKSRKRRAAQKPDEGRYIRTEASGQHVKLNHAPPLANLRSIRILALPSLRIRPAFPAWTTLAAWAHLLTSVEQQPEEYPAMIARLMFELVIMTSGLSIIIYELVTTLAEMF